MTRTAPQVLLVEDNLLDVELFQAAFARAKVEVKLHHAVDGAQALDRLRGRSGNRPLRPDFVVLDLNMPRMDGRAFLREVKADAELRRLPVLVCTNSRNEADIAAVYELQASCYLVKPAEFADFVELVRAMDAFWFRRVEPPPRPNTTH